MAHEVSRPVEADGLFGGAGWLSSVQERVHGALEELLDLPDEANLDPRWLAASAKVRAYTLRPAKRLRPALLMAGAMLAGHKPNLALWRFAAGMELLHTFLLIHDDIADCADLRRGGRALHLELAPGKMGEDLAVVAGDHLFARSIEAMLASGCARAPGATRYMLAICRHTAVGQHLDLELSQAPLDEISLWQTLKVAHLKTAKYGFVAPLVTGAMLGGAPDALIETLERIGRHLGLAYQLRDDLIGVFGDPKVSGKSSDSDLLEGKRTFPVIAAYTRADDAGRAEFEALWNPGRISTGDVPRARTLIERHGGATATSRVIARATRSAQRALEALPPSELTAALTQLMHTLAGRQS